MDCSVGKWEGTPLRFREMQVTYAVKDGACGDMLIKNITHRGMGCEYSGAPVVTGETISVALPFLGDRSGIVRWSKDGKCGIEMDHPLDVDCLNLYSNMVNG